MLYVPNYKCMTMRILRILVTLHRAPRTADQLSKLFGVTKRTIFRDLRFIQEAGIRIEKISGNNLSGEKQYRCKGL